MRARTCSLLVAGTCLAMLGLAIIWSGCGSSSGPTTTVAQTTTTAPTTTEAPRTDAIKIVGKVDKPQTITVAQIKTMQLHTATYKHPKYGPTEYTGILMTDFVKMVGVRADATTVTLSCSDGYMAVITLSEMDKTSLLAIEKNTFTAVMPGMYGKAWAYWIVKADFE